MIYEIMMSCLFRVLPWLDDADDKLRQQVRKTFPRLSFIELALIRRMDSHELLAFIAHHRPSLKNKQQVMRPDEGKENFPVTSQKEN